MKPYELISAAIEAAKADDRIGLIPFITAGYPEPAGLTSRQLLQMLHRLKNLKNIKIIDIVEVNPKKDINNMTSKLAAKILAELN